MYVKIHYSMWIYTIDTFDVDKSTFDVDLSLGLANLFQMMFISINISWALSIEIYKTHKNPRLNTNILMHNPKIGQITCN